MRSPLITIASFVVLCVVFAISYSQSPLYTSNQNQYFLHGLAAGGFGSLRQDWLANTLDPTPLFSRLVEIVYQTTHEENLFYGIYALMMGIYASSLLGIADLLFNLRSSNGKGLAFLAGFIVLHSAGLRFAISSALGSSWAYVLEDGVADQRLLGPVIQPSVFGVFLALSVYLFFIHRPYLALLSMAIAVSFHPTYLLPAAMLTVAYCLITWIEEKKLLKPLLYGLAALVMVSPVLYYVYTSFGSSSPERSARAQEILVTYRIPHHSLVSEWFDATVLVKLALVAIAALLAFQSSNSTGSAGHGKGTMKRLGLLLVITGSLSILLTLLQFLTRSNTLALVFPWRISTLLVPLSSTMLLAFLVNDLKVDSASTRRLTYLGCTVLIFLSLLAGGIRFVLEVQRRDADPERRVESYIYAHKSPGDVYLTPIKMQDFRLETGAPAFIDFKSIPYRDSDIIEWRRRVRLADGFYDRGDCSQLEVIRQEGGITQVILPATPATPICNELEEIYSDDAYILAALK